MGQERREGYGNYGVSKTIAMEKKLLTVSVGIPAYNEEANIKKLITQILAQNEVGFVLEKVIVISDGSSDGTIVEVQSVSDPRVDLVAGTSRRGKAVRVMELLDRAQSDILIQLDADVKIEDSELLKKVARFAECSPADLYCIQLTPLAPRTFVERLGVFGVKAWFDALQYLKSKLVFHCCSGGARGFSKAFYKQFVMPSEADVIEDKYSYMYAVTHGFKAAVVPGVEVKYRLPATAKDFLKQMRRFKRGDNALMRFFGDESVFRESTIESKYRLLSLIKNFFSAPFTALSYIVIQMFSRFTAGDQHDKPGYDSVSSTKQL